ncbi:MAG TPA: RagB/SusD family nutrient uptake outer membrane protein [Cyclobacteriaceae bacterium]|nr:RagB/SusD family nutrient uptake outer membrane protein [Cyclobacteriaceae bacterium]
MKNNNNNIRIIFTFLLTIGMVTSCKDFLNVNPVTSFGPDKVFSDVPNATSAVIGIYAALGGDNGYGIRLTMYYPYDSDDLMGQGATPYPDNERRDIAHYNVQPSNTQLATPFNQLYVGIERANICIYYIPKMALYTSGTAEEQTALKSLHGEALALRAQFYAELIRNWGDVPAQYLPSNFEGDLFKSRADRNSIYEHILADLGDAAALVPWRSTSGTNNERITQGAVRALRARIALARGGYSLKDNAMVRSSDYKTYYQIAKDECNAIIQSNEHHLNPSFQSVFKDGITAHAQEPNGEIIWQIGMTGGSSGTGDSKLAYYNGPRVNGNGNGALTILPTYFYQFDPNDSRRDVTCAPYDITNGIYVPRSLVNMVDGKFRRDWITNPAPSPSSTQQYFGLAWPVVRYSDVLLMYAEADNEINNGPSPAAIAALEQVRTRAFGVNPIGTTPTDYTGFFDYLAKERLLELGGEGIRKYDLIRWNMLAAKIAETKANLTLMMNGTAPYNSLPATMYATLNQAVGTPWTPITWKTSFYTPAPGSPPASSTAVTWIGSLPSSGISGTLLQFYGISFTPNKSELLPLATSVLDSNPSLSQNFGF